jgi:hypothetical protein
MTSLLEQCRQTGSFAAGILIGLACVTAVFGATEADSSTWQTLLVVAAPVILALGLALQILVTAKNPGVD